MSARRPSSLALVVVVAATQVATAGARVAAAADASAPTHVRFDPVLGAFSGPLPHGAAFLLDITPGPDENGALVRYAAVDGKTCPAQLTGDVKGPILGVLGPAPSGGTDHVISTAIPKLGYNHAYCFSVTLLKQWSDLRRQTFLTDFTARLKNVVETRQSVMPKDVKLAVNAALGDLATAEATKPAHAKLADVIYDAIDPYLTNAINGSIRYGEQRISWDQDVAKLLTDGLTAAALGGADPSAFVDATKAVKALAIPSGVSLGSPPASLSSASGTVDNAVDGGRALWKQSCAGPSSGACPILTKLNNALARAATCLISLRTAWSQTNDAFANVQQALESNSRVTTVVPIEGPPIVPSQPGFTERAGMYISGSVGMAAPYFRRDGWDIALFVGINLYFAAIDKDIPLREDDGFSKRFSIVAGYTLSGVNSSSGDAKGALGGNGALLGAALRLTDYVQLGGGAVFVRQSSDNPLVSGTRVRIAPYLSLSVDIDIVDLIKGIFTKAKS